MWPFRAPATDDHRLLLKLEAQLQELRDAWREYEARLTEHDDKLQQLGRRMKKLQGEFNGYMRDRYEADELYDTDEENNG